MKKLLALITIIGYFFAGPLATMPAQASVDLDDVGIPVELPNNK